MKRVLFFSLLCCTFATVTAQATETQVVVRVKAKDAKFVGSSLGGAHVLIRNVANGEILAEGLTQGSTGNTGLIMKEAHTRGMALADERTAKFLAIIDLDEPTFVRIEATSPANHRSAQAHVSTELWLIPGKDILGDGVVLEVSGFIIDILAPRTHAFRSMNLLHHAPVVVEANIVMMCGCTISEGGLWDSEAIEVKALVKKDGQLIKEVALAWESANLFKGEVPLASAGLYEFTVYAYNPNTGNTGVDRVNFVVGE